MTTGTPGEPPRAEAPGTPVDPPKPGPGTGAGFGIGCGAYVLATPIAMATTVFMVQAAGSLGRYWPYLIIALLSVILMIPKKSRRIGTGMLIASAAAWIVVIGPCLGFYDIF